MTKHTPGPWKAARNSAFWEVVKPWPGQTLEEANDYSPSVAHAWGTTEQEAEANASLIAAAPELLEALNELANGYSGNRWDVGIALRLKKARSAIAKATGEPA